MAKKGFALLVITLFTCVAILPLLYKGFPPTHDGEYHVIRFYEFFKTLSSGSLYPRWAFDLNNAYGLPLFNYVYPLPNYVAALFHVVGFSFIESFKYNLVLATFIGAFSFYFFAKYFTNTFAAAVGAILYVFAPYRLVDMYVRGSVGEVWSLAVFPFLLWSLAILIKERKYSYIGLCAASFSLLIFSHNILAILFLPFLASYTLYLIWQTKKRLRSVFLAFASLMLGLGMAAIFWLPALLEKKYVRGLEVYNYKDHFSDIPSLIFPSWGTGFAGDATNGMSTQVGVVNLLIIFLGFVFSFLFFKKRNWLFFLSLAWLLFALLLMLPSSGLIWEVMPFFHFAQFPWRYLSLVILLCSFLAAMLVSVIPWRKSVGVCLIILAVVTTINYTKPAYYHNREDSHYISRDNFIYSTNSPGNAFNTLWMDAQQPKKKGRVIVFSGKGTIADEVITPEQYRFNLDALTPVTLLVNTAFFPGWKTDVSGVSVPMKRTGGGLMKLTLPKGNSFVSIRFADTIVRRVAVVTSLFSLLVTVIVSVFFIRHRQKNESSS